MKPPTPTKAQNAAVARKYGNRPHPFGTVTLEDGQSLDAMKWFAQRDMEGLVDEACGGIIGYVNSAHADRIAALLNMATLDNLDVGK